MKISELRKSINSLNGMPPDYDGDILTPAQLSPEACPHFQRAFLIKVGELAIHFLNMRRVSK